VPGLKPRLGTGCRRRCKVQVKPRILFVSHSASRNGASLLLLHLLRWLRDHVDYELEVLMSGTGELLEDFRGLCKTRVWRDPAATLEGWPRRWKKRLQPDIASQCLSWWMAGRKYDLVYLNTAATHPYVSVLARHAGSVLWHIHELGYALRLAMGEQSVEAALRNAGRFISVSRSVTSTLVEEFRIPADRVDLVHGFVPFPDQTPAEVASIRRRIRRQLGWSDEAFVVGGCGSLGWRKGTDIFLQIAHRLCGMQGNDATRFLWVGGEAGGNESLQFQHDVRAFGLAGRCTMISNTANAVDYYHAMDVFALTSREDPFPLVMLEAGARGLPVVCFDRSGGALEFVGHDAGLIADYLDVDTFAAHLVALSKSPKLRRQLGIAAAQKVKVNHVVSTQGPKVAESINRCLSSTMKTSARGHFQVRQSLPSSAHVFENGKPLIR